MTEAKLETDSQKNQSRYNLRRRKDDGDGAKAKPEQPEVKEAEVLPAPIVTSSTPLDFGGKIGGLQGRDEKNIEYVLNVCVECTFCILTLMCLCAFRSILLAALPTSLGSVCVTPSQSGRS